MPHLAAHLACVLEGLAVLLPVLPICPQFVQGSEGVLGGTDWGALDATNWGALDGTNWGALDCTNWGSLQLCRRVAPGCWMVARCVLAALW